MSLTKELVEEIFAPLAKDDAASFFKNVDPNVDWTVTGTANPLSARYTGVRDFVGKTFMRLGALMDGPTGLEVKCVTLDNNTRTACVELKANGKAKNGRPFDNDYAWVCVFNEQNKIVTVRAYLDSALVKLVIEENESA